MKPVLACLFLACLAACFAACSSGPDRAEALGMTGRGAAIDTNGDGLPDAWLPGAGADGQSAFRSFHDRDGDGLPDASARVVFRDQDGDGLPDAVAPRRR